MKQKTSEDARQFMKHPGQMILPFFVVLLVAPGGYTVIALIVEFRVN